MVNKVFDRVEKKYLITNVERLKLLKVIKNYTKKDEYHKSKVFNLYFDNDNYDLIVQSIEQPNFKEKVRARSYGGYDRVFFEIKTKLRRKDDANVGYKRRVMITNNDFDEYLAGNVSMEDLAKRSIEKGTDIQIAREVDYLINHFYLKPKILVIYDRDSYRGEDNLRITFDKKLRYRDADLNFSEKDDKIFFKDKRNIIMEIKAHGAFPLWLARLLSENRIYSQRFSKIGNIYAKLRKEKNV